MWSAVLAVLFAVSLQFPFGDAEATALVVNDDGSAILEVSVDVIGSPAAVLVRGVGILDELPPVALAPRGGGEWGGLVELNTTAGVLLAFEFLHADGGRSEISELHTLVELGVDPAALIGRAPLAPSTRVPPSEVPAPIDFGSSSSRWGWLTLGAGLAGGALLLVWLWMGKAEVTVEETATDSPQTP